MTKLALETKCHDVKKLLDSAAELMLLDCRETSEHQICTIEGAQLLPMSELASSHEELVDMKETHVVVYCHHGMRSAQVATWLREQGFARAQSMAGGIDQWSLEIDPAVSRY